MNGLMDRVAFPVPSDYVPLSHRDEKVCVVSIIGKSSYKAFSSKATIFNPILDADIFKGVKEDLTEQINQGEIECYYDVDSNVIYLHHTSLQDTIRLTHVCQKLQSVPPKDFQSMWQQEEFHHAKSLLLLFQLSHIIVVSHPGSSFDITYVRLFRILDSIRLKIQKSLSDQLLDFPVSKDWKYNGRPCSPRVLFVFERCTIEFDPDEVIEPPGYRSRPQRLSPVKRLQHCMEDQIYKILRKSRVITNISNNSLFAVPANQEFVFLQVIQTEATDPVAFYLQQIRDNCTCRDAETLKKKRLFSQLKAFELDIKWALKECISNDTEENVVKDASGKAGESHDETEISGEMDDDTDDTEEENVVKDASGKAGESHDETEISGEMDDDTDDTEEENVVKDASGKDCESHDETDDTEEDLDYHQHEDQAESDEYVDDSDESDSPRSRSYQTIRRGNTVGGVERSQSRSSPMNKTPSEFSFKEFLWQHVDMALTKGFDDNVGRHPVAATFELPTSETWFAIASKMYGFFFSEKLDPKIQPHFNTLKSLLETDLRFSENRCNKVLPVAEGSYQENLPSHYVTNYHLSKLVQAKKVFNQFARGPACDKYLRQLEESCDQFWKNGRQLCEEVSLTGNHCVNPLHKTEDQIETESNKHLPVMTHTSQLKMKSACNCGKKQADKDDPFDHKAANYDFYNKMEDGCCGKLERFAFPVFQPSTSDVRAAAFSAEARARLAATKSTPKDSSVKGDMASVTSGVASLSLALSLGQSGGSDLYGHGGQSNCSPLPDQDSVSNPDHTEAQIPASPVSPGPTRQHSTTEYLPGMINTESPQGLLPKFPSWSLICLGKSTLYSHTQGLDLPGFLSGSNFLLPWDITVRAEKDKWPSVGESVGKKGKQKKVVRELTEVTLRVYIGEEYECPRGHRFFCSGPEKIIKVSSTSTVKDNANKLVNLDMPLYCPCHCRSSKSYMAQLMRLYVVTPDGPLRVSINPLIQPAPHPCPIFHPGTGGEIDLGAGSLWVLRLPSVYMGDQGPYTMPSDASQLPRCCLLKGVFNFREMSGES